MMRSVYKIKIIVVLADDKEKPPEQKIIVRDRRERMAKIVHKLRKVKVTQTGELIIRVGKEGSCVPGMLMQVTNKTLQMTV
jgi:hypothetical protein